nr:reverse transcriptase domain-containing protein [Tanacetum cinerariifolium]
MSDAEHSIVTYTSISSDDGSLDVGSPPYFIPEPVYPEFMLPEDQPPPVADSPTTDLPGYITKSDFEEDLKEEDDEDPIDRDDDEESSRDDADDEEEEEEHLALADSIPPPAYHTTARMSIPSPPLLTSPTDAGVPLGYKAAMIRLIAKSPSTTHPLPIPPPIVLPHTRASMFMMRDAAPSTYILAPRSETPPSKTPPLLPISLPTSSLPFLLPSTDCKGDVLEVMLPPRKRLCIALSPKFKVGSVHMLLLLDLLETLEHIMDLDEIIDEILAADVEELSQRMTDFVTTVRLDTYEIYGRLDDAQDDRLLMSDQRHAWDPTHIEVPEEAARDAGGSQNDDDSHNLGTGSRRTERTTRECTYTDFLKCQPMNFKGTKGVVDLTQWFERIKTVFNISKCAVENQVKFATCTLHGVALAWGTRAGQNLTCFKCRAQGHFKRKCLNLKNNNRGNQGRNGNAGTNLDFDVITHTFLLNNCYASILFDTGVDSCFMSTAFSSQIDITPTTLDHYYDVELADGRIIRLNTIIRGCTLNFLNHPFNIELMPVELGSFDVIIGMDWLEKYQAVIVCAEKIICIPWGNESLIVRGDRSHRRNET